MVPDHLEAPAPVPPWARVIVAMRPTGLLAVLAMHSQWAAHTTPDAARGVGDWAGELRAPVLVMDARLAPVVDDALLERFEACAYTALTAISPRGVPGGIELAWGEPRDTPAHISAARRTDRFARSMDALRDDGVLKRMLIDFDGAIVIDSIGLDTSSSSAT